MVREVSLSLLMMITPSGMTMAAVMEEKSRRLMMSGTRNHGAGKESAIVNNNKYYWYLLAGSRKYKVVNPVLLRLSGRRHDIPDRLNINRASQPLLATLCIIDSQKCNPEKHIAYGEKKKERENVH